MKDTLCIGGGHSHHQFGVNLVGFHAIIFTVIIQILSKRKVLILTIPYIEGLSESIQRVCRDFDIKQHLSRVRH